MVGSSVWFRSTQQHRRSIMIVYEYTDDEIEVIVLN